MSHAEKSAFYKELKDAGVQLDRTYQQYTTEELRAAVTLLRAKQGPPEPEPAPELPELPEVQAPPAPRPQQVRPPVQTEEMAGERLNSKPEDEPIRIDDDGKIWYQNEVTKPSYPKPRGRRVLRYIDPGTETKTVVNGQYLETFEVAGSQARQAEVKITLPSYQVGIYKDPRFPFKIHVYNDRRGFDLFEVQAFYGGSELVPEEIKRVYIENVLCYDIRTTVRAIQTEHRQQQLQGMKGL